MASTFKFIKCLEWCTIMPALNHPIESPVFLLKDWECLFRIALEKQSTWYYNLYMEVKKNEHSEWKPCNIKLRIGFKDGDNFNLCEKTCEVSECGKTEIWYITMNDFETKRPSNYMDGNWVKFWFCFEDEAGHLLKNRKETDDKSVQTPSYIDRCFLMEELSSDFSQLFNGDSHHDVTFTCGSETIKAHKNVLCCRSNVFASMLQSDMVEGKTGQVKIQDMETTIFQQFLRCLYTGVLPDLTYETAVKFYEVGDKYNVPALKKQCAEFLVDHLSPDNACDILILADAHNDSEFKERIFEYFIREKLPYRGDTWADFCNTNPKLANEVLNLFCQHFRSKIA